MIQYAEKQSNNEYDAEVEEFQKLVAEPVSLQKELDQSFQRKIYSCYWYTINPDHFTVFYSPLGSAAVERNTYTY